MIRDGFVDVRCFFFAKVAIILRNATTIGTNSDGTRLFFEDSFRKVGESRLAHWATGWIWGDARVALRHDGIEPK